MGGARGAGRGVANPSSGVHRGEGMIFSHLQRSLQDTRFHSLLFIFGFFDCAGKNGRKKTPFLSGVAERRDRETARQREEDKKGRREEGQKRGREEGLPLFDVQIFNYTLENLNHSKTLNRI